MRQKLITGMLIVVLLSGGLTVYHLFFTPRNAYIEIQKVFNGFVMKKELQKKYEQTQTARKKVIDSLSIGLQAMSQQLRNTRPDEKEIEKFNFDREQYFKQKKQFDEDDASLSSKYNKQILDQMTQYIIDFGKKERYDIIYGADGNGTLMYANDKYNISDEVLEYINQKYQGVE